MRQDRQLASAKGLAKVEAALRLGLSRLGFFLPPRVFLSGWVENALVERPGGEGDIPQAERLARITGAVARRLPLRTRCLHRSLVLVWLLRRRGVGGRLRIGVRRTDQGIDAHAWVEVARSPVNDSPEHCSEFAAFEIVEEGLAELASLENVA